jgi:hypothetical protein
MNQLLRHSYKLSYLGRNQTCVEIINRLDDPRRNEIFKLRHTVLSNAPNSPFTRNHPMVHGDEIRDEYDEMESTKQYLIRSPGTGKPIASIRTTDANDGSLEMEKYGWFPISDDLRSEGLVEWSRLVSLPEVRGSNAVPILYYTSVTHKQMVGNQNIIFMVDQKATRLLEYYNKWASVCNVLTDEPINCDEFEKGRRSHVVLMPMGEKVSLSRAKFTAAVRVPCILGVSYLNTPK